MAMKVSVLPDELAYEFDQEPAELALTLLLLADGFLDPDGEEEGEGRLDFLRVFRAAVLDHDPAAQTRIYDLLKDMAAAIDGSLL